VLKVPAYFFSCNDKTERGKKTPHIQKERERDTTKKRTKFGRIVKEPGLAESEK
jgi:hypothetical protein